MDLQLLKGDFLFLIFHHSLSFVSDVPDFFDLKNSPSFPIQKQKTKPPPFFFFYVTFELLMCSVPQRTNGTFRDPSKPSVPEWSSQSLNTDDASFFMARVQHLALPSATSTLKCSPASWRRSADHQLPTETVATYVWTCDHSHFKKCVPELDTVLWKFLCKVDA